MYGFEFLIYPRGCLYGVYEVLPIEGTIGGRSVGWGDFGLSLRLGVIFAPAVFPLCGRSTSSGSRKIKGLFKMTHPPINIVQTEIC